jgi:5-methylcytosine-specific restriction endonuclease McrA
MAWSKKNPAKVAKAQKKYFASEKGKAALKRRSKQKREYAKVYLKTPSGRASLRITAAKKRATIKQATPKWADLKEIHALYTKAALLGLVVDHIVPLRGKLVRGLHTIDNLQLLSSKENSQKSNVVWPDMP